MTAAAKAHFQEPSGNLIEQKRVWAGSQAMDWVKENDHSEHVHSGINAKKLQGGNILVVEDDEDMAQLAKLLIEELAHAKCDVVTDSYEAIERLCEKSYDYLVIDQNLPGMRGLDILKKLDKYLDRDPLLFDQKRFSEKIPVIMMSAHRVNVPKSFGKLNHFEITNSVEKRKLGKTLAAAKSSELSPKLSAH